MFEQSKNFISNQDILDVIHSIKYGTVEITIHDNKIVQVERKEKLRAINIKKPEAQ